MAYSREAHELLDASLEILKTKKGKFAWPYMVGLLMPTVNFEDAQRIAEIINDLEEDN